MVDLVAGQKVWVRESKCGYKGPVILIGPLFGSSWLVKAQEGKGQVFVARSEMFDPIKEAEQPSLILSKEERKELKRKLKAERKNHKPRGDSGGRR